MENDVPVCGWHISGIHDYRLHLKQDSAARWNQGQRMFLPSMHP